MQKRDSKLVFGTDSSVYAPILVLTLLLVVSGATGLYSVAQQRYYAEHVGLELMPAISVATEAESAMYKALNAERGLLLAGDDKLRRDRLIKEHAEHLEVAADRITDLEHHVEEEQAHGEATHEHEHGSHIESQRSLALLLDNWSRASKEVAQLALQKQADLGRTQFALSESMISFTELNTRIKDLKHGIVDIFRADTSHELFVVGVSRVALMVLTVAGVLWSLFSIAYLKRKLLQLVSRLNLHVQRQDFTRQIGESLEMKDTPEGLNEIASRVLTELCRENKAEFLISSSNQELVRAAENTNAGPAQCKVDKNLACVAMRRGQVSIFEDSHAINTCPYLADRGDEAMAAICAPVTFMGAGLGVIHATYPVNRLPEEERQEQIKVFSTQLAARMGTVRAFGHTQSLALTDPLTELLNRRGLEEAVQDLDTQPYALAMIDLDFFKQLNDTHGHEAGDIALKTFADALRTSLPKDALVCRWGGEEFSAVLPLVSTEQAQEYVVNVFDGLVERLQFVDVPAFTASAGLADTTMGGSFLALTMLADEALYQAKADGRNCIVDAKHLDRSEGNGMAGSNTETNSDGGLKNAA